MKNKKREALFCETVSTKESICLRQNALMTACTGTRNEEGRHERFQLVLRLRAVLWLLFGGSEVAKTARHVAGLRTSLTRPRLCFEACGRSSNYGSFGELRPFVGDPRIEKWRPVEKGASERPSKEHRLRGLASSKKA